MGYFLFLVLFCCIFACNKSSANKQAAALILVFMVLLNGLRGMTVGQDTASYYLMFSSSSISDRIEPLFAALIAACRFLGLSYNAFLVIIAILIYAPLYYAFKTWSLNPCLSFLVYIVFSTFFFVNSFNVLRNAVASSLLFLAIGYWRVHDLKKSALLLLSSVGFHYSAIVVIPFLLLAKLSKNIKPTVAIVLILLSMIIGISFPFYENLLSSVFQQISGLSGAVMDNYSGYLGNVEESEANAKGVIMLVGPFSLLSVLSFLSKDTDKLWAILLFYGVIIGNLFVGVLYTYRLTVYLTMFSLLLVPQLVNRHNSLIRFVTLCLTFVMVAYFVYSLITGRTLNILPYKFYFEV